MHLYCNVGSSGSVKKKKKTPSSEGKRPVSSSFILLICRNGGNETNVQNLRIPSHRGELCDDSIQLLVHQHLTTKAGSNMGSQTSWFRFSSRWILRKVIDVGGILTYQSDQKQDPACRFLHLWALPAWSMNQGPESSGRSSMLVKLRMHLMKHYGMRAQTTKGMLEKHSAAQIQKCQKCRKGS